MPLHPCPCHFIFQFLVESLEFSPCTAAAMLTNSASGGDPPSGCFDRPTLDLDSTALLHGISEHGGYAYVSMAALVANGDIRTVEAVCEMAWEQLHSGPWHSVLPVWRDTYSMACLLVASHHYRNSEFRDTLRVLDLGIMGGTLLCKGFGLLHVERFSQRDCLATLIGAHWKNAFTLLFFLYLWKGYGWVWTFTNLSVVEIPKEQKLCRWAVKLWYSDGSKFWKLWISSSHDLEPKIES